MEKLNSSRDKLPSGSTVLVTETKSYGDLNKESLGTWVTDEGVGLDLFRVTKHTVSGQFYFKSLTLNTIPFTGVTEQKEDETVFVAFFDTYVPENQLCNNAMLKGFLNDEDLSKGIIRITLYCWDPNNQGSFNTRELVLTKTTKPVNDFALRQFQMSIQVSNPFGSVN